MIKAHSSERMVSSGGISDVVIASVHSEKTRLKNLMMMKMIMLLLLPTRASERGYVIRAGVHLNSTLAIDLPFQTLAVVLSSNL